MCHGIRIVSQLMFKCSYFDFVYCDFDVNYLVFEIEISFYCHLFLSANVRHNQTANRKDHSLSAIFLIYSIFSNRNQMSLFSRKVYDKLITMTGKKVGCPCSLVRYSHFSTDRAQYQDKSQSRSQSPRAFWSAPRHGALE